MTATAAETYQVFLSYNHHDRTAVRALKRRLAEFGITAWLDEDELRPGLPWSHPLESGIRAAMSVAILVGAHGVGPWADEEMQAALRLAVKEKRSVIPVLLPGASDTVELPMFLGNRTWVDLRAGLSSKNVEKLIWGITGQKPKCGAVLKPKSGSTSKTLRDSATRWTETQLRNPHFSLKYNPSRYVTRAVERDIELWLAADSLQKATCFLLLAAAGSGKTNLLCHVAERSLALRPTVLLAGAQLRLVESTGLWGVVADAVLGPSLGGDIASIRDRVRGEAASDPGGMAIVVDAINEYHDPIRLKREILSFLEDVRGTRVSVVISCRDYYWGVFDTPQWSVFLRISSAEGDRKTTRRTLGNFTPDEAKSAFEIYFTEYDVGAKPEGNALEQFRHPLLLRFFCETYRGQSLGVLRDVRLKDLFDRYWLMKLESIANRMIDQGEVGTIRDVADYIGRCLVDVARHMLAMNARLISADRARELTHSTGLISTVRAPYGRILDEHIILEEFQGGQVDTIPMVAFVFEEFMEYAMARALVNELAASNVAELQRRVIELTARYQEFNQVFGVMLYLALMLKDRGVALWPMLIGLGEQWEQVVIEAFRKLPTGQIDDGVFQAIIDLLEIPNAEVQIQALELLKFGRLQRLPTEALTAAVGRLVTHKQLSIRRRAILALASCPPSFAVPLIERAVTTRMHRKGDQYVVIRNANHALGELATEESFRVMAKIRGGYWHSKWSEEPAVLRANVQHLLKLLDSDDFLVRCGAIMLLGRTRSRIAVAALEGYLQLSVASSAPIDLKRLPPWVERGIHFVELSNKARIKSEIEIERDLVAESLASLRKDQAVSDKQDGWMTKIAEARAKPRSTGLPASLATLPDAYESPAAIVHILKSGLEHRGGIKWHVRKLRDGFRICAPRGRMRNGSLTSEDKATLARLLDLASVGDEGVLVKTGYRHTDYEKEYVCRAWGVPPTVLGRTNDYWD